MNWWECGNIVSPQRIEEMHDKLKKHQVKGNSLSCISKSDIMDVFGIKNLAEATKLYDSIRLLLEHSFRVEKKDEVIPPKFLCPICDKIMKDPVIALDGSSYCHLCLEGWFKNNKYSPVDSQKPLNMSNGNLVSFPNEPLEQELSRFFDIHPQLKDENGADVQVEGDGDKQNTTKQLIK